MIKKGRFPLTNSFLSVSGVNDKKRTLRRELLDILACRRFVRKLIKCGHRRVKVTLLKRKWSGHACARRHRALQWGKNIVGFSVGHIIMWRSSWMKPDSSNRARGLIFGWLERKKRPLKRTKKGKLNLREEIA